MAQATEFGASANWPLVAGIGILGAVLIYALYLVNQQLNTVTSPASSALSSAGQIANQVWCWLTFQSGNCLSGGSDQ